MLSNLATYFFGGNEQDPAGQEPSLEVRESPEGVLVSNPAQGTHGLTMIVNGGQATNSNARLEKSISEDTEDEWVMVADTTHPDPLTLGSLSEPNPRPPTGSTGSSATPSESGDEDDGEMESPSMSIDQDPEIPGRPVALTRSARRLTSPFSCQSSASLSQMKAMRSAQVAKLKKSAKATTAKTIERKNKAVKNNQVSFSKKAFTNRNNLAIKAAGANKQLKQC